MKKKKLSLKQQGKKLNEEGRRSPLEMLQRRMEYHERLADEELAKGNNCSREKIAAHLAAAQSAAVELAPYRHPRLQASAVTHSADGDLAKLLAEIDGCTRGLFASPPIELPDDSTTKH